MTDNTKKYNSEELVGKILSWYDKSGKQEEGQRKIWEKCFAYVNNWVDGELGQWESKIRNQLGDKPAISFNEIKKFVNRICGSQRLTKIDEKIYGRDDKSDPIIAEVLNDLLKYVYDLNMAEWHIARSYRDAIICGRGFLKVEWNDENDPLGDITIKRINPYSVKIVGGGDKYDLSDRQAIIEEMHLDKDQLFSLYPEKEKELKDMYDEVDEKGYTSITSGIDYFPDGKITNDSLEERDTSKKKILKCQRFEWKEIVFIKNEQTGEFVEAPLKLKEAKEASELLSLTTGQRHIVIKKKVKKLYNTVVCGRVLISDKPTPYSHNKFDIIPIFAYTDGNMVTGVVQDLLDPQDEKNKRRSQIIHILGTAAKNSYFVKKNAIDDIEQAKKDISRTGSLIEVNGEPSQVASPIASNLSAVPAIIQMEQSSVQDMKDISGIQDASLGQVPSGVKSGRGLQALQMPTETMIGELFDNYLVSRKILAKLTISLIQQFYNEPKVFRIRGDFSSQMMSQDQQMQQQMGIMSMSDSEKVMKINTNEFNKVDTGQYDVVIDHVSQNPTTRRAQYFDLMNMKSQGAPIKWSTVIKFSDIRGRLDLLRDAMQAEGFIEQQGMMAQMAQGDKSASAPRNPLEADEGFNIAGMQSPMQ